MRIRRFVALSVICAVFLSSFSAPAAFAYDDGVYFSGMKSPELFDSSSDIRVSVAKLSEATDIQQLKDTLLSSIVACKETVELLSLRIPSSLAGQLADFIWYNMPEAFGVGGIGYYTSGGFVQKLTLSYTDFADTKEEYALCMSRFTEGADSILLGIEGNTRLSDTEKALLLHDRLAADIEYDYVTDSFERYTAYGAFANKSAVCQGYAMAYMYLLQRVGIENYYCSSQKLNHGWNIVYIGGRAYHVDVTWDDVSWYSPDSKGVEGRIEHDNFLRSTEGIISTGHTADDFDSLPSDTAYDNAFWRSSSTQFVLVSNEIYYIDNEAQELKRYSDGKKLCGVSGKWKASESSFWMGNFSCLDASGGDLLYSLPDGIYRYSVSANTSEKIFAPSMNSLYSVFGFSFSDGFLCCEINNSPLNSTNLQRIKQPYSPSSVVLSYITVNTLPDKTVYYIGDSFISDGFSVKAVYSDNSQNIIRSGFSFSGFSSAAAGKKNITVSYGGYDIVFSVDVKKPVLTLSYSSVTLTQNEKLTLTAETQPAAVSVSWSSSAPDVVSVKNGVCTALKKGESVITAEFTYNSRKYSAACTVKVLCAHTDTEIHPAIQPTCKETGLTEGLYCNSCKEYLSGRVTVPIDYTAHKWDSGTVIFAPSCTTIGQTLFTCVYDSSHIYYETYDKDPNVHTNTSVVPEEKPENGRNGYTEGVFCHSCLRYISGHEVIPAFSGVFKDSESAEMKDNFVFALSGVTVSDILAASPEGAYVTDAYGRICPADSGISTGLILCFADSGSYETVLPGDTDCDGRISAADARIVLRASVGLESFSEGSAKYRAADVSADNMLTAADARAVLRASVGLEQIKL